MIDKVIEQLKSTARPFKEINSFSDQPGIYAIFFYGNTFPLKDYKNSKKEIIYIGKTLKSQKSRDADTHFKTGKTGSSTVRKTIGCLLHNEFKLIPIPRSQSDIDKKRWAHFKFDNKSEDQLTEWMKGNLGLSFFSYPKSPKEIDELETLLINRLVPILNIDRKNITNKYYSQLRGLRKQMGEIAYYKNKSIKAFPVQRVKENSSFLKSGISFSTTTIHKYEEIWKKVIPQILHTIENNTPLKIQLQKDDFDKAGNRKNYSFNLEFRNGRVSNNINGSAVARDLARLLEDNKQFKIFLKRKEIKFRMGKDFVLEIHS